MIDPERNKIMEMLYAEHYDELVLKCLAVIHYAPEMRTFVEECVQDTFLKAIAEYDDLQSHPDISRWLFLTCYNHMRNIRHVYYHRSKKHKFSFDAYPGIEIADPIDAFRKFDEGEEYADCLKRIYTLLFEKEKSVFDDYFIHHESLDNISKHTGKTKSAVKSMIYRIRRRLERNFMSSILIFFFVRRVFSIPE